MVHRVTKSQTQLKRLSSSSNKRVQQTSRATIAKQRCGLQQVTEQHCYLHACLTDTQENRRILDLSAATLLVHLNVLKGHTSGLPGWLSSQESACQRRRHRFDPWVGKIPGVGNGHPLQYSCLGNPMHRGAW